MYGDRSFDFDKRRLVYQWFRLRIDCVCRICVVDGRNRLSLFRFSGVIKLDVALEGSCSFIGRFLSQLLLLFLDLLFVRRRDDAPTSSPGCTSAKAYPRPVFVPDSGSVHNGFDIIEELAFAGNQGACVSFLEAGVFIHGKSDCGSPLGQRVHRVEMEKVTVFASCRNAENVLQRLDICGSSRKSFNLILCQ